MRATFSVILCALAICTLSACNYSLQPDSNNAERFKLISTQDGKVIRLDVISGEIALVKDNELVSLGRGGIIHLEVGKTYLLENGKHGKYLGDQKFDTSIEDLLNKYAPQPKKTINWKDLK